MAFIPSIGLLLSHSYRKILGDPGDDSDSNSRVCKGKEKEVAVEKGKEKREQGQKKLLMLNSKILRPCLLRTRKKNKGFD